MDLLADWLRTGGPDCDDISVLINRINSDINSLEADIRRELKLKNDEKWPFIFKDNCKYLKDVNVKVSDIDAKLRIYEEESLPQARELRDSVVKKKEQLAESFALKAKQEGKNDEDERDEGHELIEGDKDDDDLEFLKFETLTENEIERCQSLDELAGVYLREARRLIKKDLFPLIQVGCDLNNEPISSEFTIDQSLFNFPACKISQSVHEFVILLQEILRNSGFKKDSDRMLYFQASRDICELYLISLQYYSPKLVEENHQYSAVHHNNCLYVAHNLMTLPALFELRNSDDFIVTYMDIIPALKEAAYRCVTTRLKKDREIIKEFIQDESVIKALQSDDSKMKNNNHKLLQPFQKALKKSLAYITSIRDAWHDILPNIVSNKLVATLVNTLVFYVVDSIVKLEDISTENTNQLETIFEQFSLDIEDLMKDYPLHLTAVVPKWLQFQELRFILQV